MTSRCLSDAQLAAELAGIDITFTVFDDGSTDGTGQTIAQLPVKSTVIQGDGSAYWAQSMAIAELTAIQNGLVSSSDYFLWLNDDVHLDSDALVRMLECAAKNSAAVIVGAMRDPQTGAITYSGLRRKGKHPLGFERIRPLVVEAQRVDTFNGNLVLVPVTVARTMGGIDGGFSHGLADIDYGLRCTRAQIHVILAPGTFGMCARNEVLPQRSILREWRDFTGAKGGGNFHSLRRILRKSHPKVWPLYVTGTYTLWWCRRLASMGWRVKQ